MGHWMNQLSLPYRYIYAHPYLYYIYIYFTAHYLFWNYFPCIRSSFQHPQEMCYQGMETQEPELSGPLVGSRLLVNVMGWFIDRDLLHTRTWFLVLSQSFLSWSLNSNNIVKIQHSIGHWTNVLDPNSCLFSKEERIKGQGQESVILLLKQGQAYILRIAVLDHECDLAPCLGPDPHLPHK